MSLARYSGQLRALNEDYYCGHLTFEEYRKLRGEIFSAVEDEMNNPQSGSKDNVLDRVMAYFKPAETNEP